MYPPLSISADEVNYLIYRYLIESGFRHSTFAFEHESQIIQKADDFRALDIRPGMLITLLHKALQLMQVELHMEDDGTERECEATLSLLYPHNCITPSSVDGSRPPPSHARNRKLSELPNANKDAPAGGGKKKEKAARADKRKGKKDRSTKSAKDKASKSAAGATAGDEDAMDVDEPENQAGGDEDDVLGDDLLIQVDDNDPAVTLTSDDLLALQDANGLYYVSAWNPVDDTLLASGSLNSLVGLWTVPTTNGRLSNVTHLAHTSDSSPSPSKSVTLSSKKSTVAANGGSPGRAGDASATVVTAIAWSPNGEYLATGTSHSKVRVFSKAGQLLNTYSVGPASVKVAPSDGSPKRGTVVMDNPVMELAFSLDSGLLACGTTAGSLVVVDVAKGKQVYSLQCSNAVMAFAWNSNHILAAGSTDHLVRLIDVNHASVIELAGHQGGVNQVSWDPSRTLLASCSDDGTIRIWSQDVVSQSSTGQRQPRVVLQGHEGEVITMDWNPNPPNGAAQIASVGTDRVVRIWDVATGSCIYAMDRHVQAHCVLAYSPDGKYLVCGSDDRYMYVWTSTAQLVRSFYACSEIVDLRFNRTGDRMAVCFGTSQMVILPLGPMLAGSSAGREDGEGGDGTG
ncbi:WD40-repeat-containing domain protein [Catenaria anguillulae PL171]|uniref:WD40-repeat-containing domain protein n=1 Tax=Catenaria anguillulae PL171 TaxID=765915 RepID=A0A1Y2HYH3_9FUNG|nr:WD40-repeat-containing domain protein [Catenaria anguillulae PL171]